MFRGVIFIGLFCIVQVQANYNIDEGEPCMSEGLQGTCRRLRYCPTVALVDLRETKFRKPKTPTICSYIGKEPVVCCTDCDATDVTKIVLTPNGIQYKLGTNKSYDMCLDYIGRLPYFCSLSTSSELIKQFDEKRGCHYLFALRHSLLIGELAERGEFPHMALLGYGEDAAPEWFCGGSVISERFILTAAHCSHHSRLGEVRHVALGLLRRSDPPERWQRHRVQRFLPHPRYRPPTKYHDIALIQTKDEIKFSSLVLPICLANRELGTHAQAVGWGAVGHNKPSSDGLRKAWLEQFSSSECAELYPQHRHQALGLDPSTQFCFGDRKDNKDTCQGDSGGPLQVWSQPVNSCVNYVIGVTSYGRACGFAGGAGVYTKVLPYMQWIEENVWP